MRDDKEGPTVGDRATYRGGGQEPRTVTAVSDDGHEVHLDGEGPFSADDYQYEEVTDDGR